MADKRYGFNARPVSDLSGEILDPVLRKRAGISVGLVQSWEEIVGPRVASRSRPEKINWPRRRSEGDPFEPATLVIACEALAAMHLQHEAGQIIERINGFLGFQAVGRLRLFQKPVVSASKPAAPELRPLDPAEKTRLATRVSPIEDEALRASLERLGHSVIARRR